MKIRAIIALLLVFAGLAAADYRLWAGSCFSFNSDYEPKRATQGSNPCRGENWSGLEGDSKGSSRNPCNRNQKLEYRRVRAGSYDIFRNNKKVGNCIEFKAPRPTKSCRMGLGNADSCVMVAMYNCRTPICNSWQ